mgnify:CR=1 FL=1
MDCVPFFAFSSLERTILYATYGKVIWVAGIKRSVDLQKPTDPTHKIYIANDKITSLPSCPSSCTGLSTFLARRRCYR